MTDEEMAEARATTFADINYNETDNYGTEKEIGYHAYYCGFLAGLKAGRPEWHKVAGGDLPKDNRLVLIQMVNGNTTMGIHYENAWREICNCKKLTGVIAWCEIPKYKEE